MQYVWPACIKKPSTVQPLISIDRVKSNFTEESNQQGTSFQPYLTQKKLAHTVHEFKSNLPFFRRGHQKYKALL